MNGVMCRKRTTNKIIRIEQNIITMRYSIGCQRLDMMNHDLSRDRSIRTSKIETVVPSYHQITNVFPFWRSIEPLVHPALGTECRTSDGSMALKIMEPIEKIRIPDELVIRPHHRPILRRNRAPRATLRTLLIAFEAFWAMLLTISLASSGWEI